MAAWWVDCSVCLVAAPFGARLPIAATVGTLPTACSLGSSLPSAPTLLADTSHPADLFLCPAAGSTAAVVRRCTPPLSGGSLFGDGLSRATFGPCTVNTAAPGVIQSASGRWPSAPPHIWLCCFACFAFSCSPPMRCCSLSLILRTTSFPLVAFGAFALSHGMPRVCGISPCRSRAA